MRFTNFRNWLLLIVFSLFSHALIAQTSMINGTVKDVKGLPLEGVVIKNKNTGATATSKKDGTYSIQANSTDQLNISSVGYQSTNIKVSSNNLNIVLSELTNELQEVVLLGSRRGGRVKTESAVPVDVININQAGIPTAKMDLTSVLNYAAPSFNYNKQTGADGADHIDLGTLRGLGPDQTLVLINGKRRHQTAFVGIFGTRGRGNSGVDLNGFAQASVDRIEILRDGASAQYGSDAMAGVINLMLKKDVNHWNINTGWSGYYDTKYNAYNTRSTNRYISSNPIDGGTVSFSANNGVKIGNKGGFINVSVSFLNQAKTFRQVADTNVLTNQNALPINYGRRAFGDGSVTTAGIMYNMEIPTSNNTIFYSFGGFNNKKSDAYAYSRNLSARPDRFPSSTNGDVIIVPDIMQKDIDGETYFNPHIQTVIQDASISMGLKGVTKNDWSWDVSNTIGRNNFHYYGDKTFNASMIGNITKTHFDDGGFNFLQNTTNLDFSKSFKSVAEGLNIGWGAELRYERYSIFKGEEASYMGYTNAFDKAPGSQGFPGFSPADEIKATRTNLGAYFDAELNVTKQWLVDGAIRVENYSDFGFVNTFKLASRYKLSDNFSLRGSISTGYRAPSLQQINFSNTQTSFSGGQLVQSRIVSNNDAITKTVGIPNLKQETSVNTSIGFAWKAAKGLTITVDGYTVKVKDRIVLSGLFTDGDNSLPVAFTSKLQSLGVATAQFFANSVNTTNVGLDIVVDYNKKWGNKSFKALLAGNIQKMQVDGINVPTALNDSYLHRKTFFSDREEAFLLASAPAAKMNLNFEYTVGKVGLGLRFTYFGKQSSKGFGWTGLAGKEGTDGPGDPYISGSFAGIDPYVDLDGYEYDNRVHVAPETFVYGAKVTTDVFGSYKFSNKVSLFVGADNLLNVHPDFAAVKNARYEAFDNETGGAWESVQMGFNGLRLFSKLVLNF